MIAFNKNILFKPLPSEDKTEGGLYVPDPYKSVNNKGTVVSVGKNVTKVKKGETVFRVKDWGDEIIINGEKHYLMNENSILAKV